MCALRVATVHATSIIMVPRMSSVYVSPAAAGACIHCCYFQALISLIKCCCVSCTSQSLSMDCPVHWTLRCGSAVCRLNVSQPRVAVLLATGRPMLLQCAILRKAVSQQTPRHERPRKSLEVRSIEWILAKPLIEDSQRCYSSL